MRIRLLALTLVGIMLSGCTIGSFRGSAGSEHDENLRTSVAALFRSAERGPEAFREQLSSDFQGNRSQMTSNLAQLRAQTSLTYTYTTLRSSIADVNEPEVLVRYQRRRSSGTVVESGEVTFIFVIEDGQYHLYDLQGDNPFSDS